MSTSNFHNRSVPFAGKHRPDVRTFVPVFSLHHGVLLSLEINLTIVQCEGCGRCFELYWILDSVVKARSE